MTTWHDRGMSVHTIESSWYDFRDMWFFATIYDVATVMLALLLQFSSSLSNSSSDSDIFSFKLIVWFLFLAAFL